MGCRRVVPTGGLIRVRRAEGGLVIGPGPGRGAWLCADRPLECLERADKRAGLARALRTPVAGGDIERLRARLAGRPSIEDHAASPSEQVPPRQSK